MFYIQYLIVALFATTSNQKGRYKLSAALLTITLYFYIV